MSGYIRTKTAKTPKTKTQDPEKPLQTGALAVKGASNIMNTVNKWNESELTNSGIEPYQFNYQIDGTDEWATGNLFQRRPLEDGNLITKHVKSSVRNPYERIQVNPELVDKFSYNDLSGEEAVRSMLTDKGIESDNIDRVLKSQPSVDEEAAASNLGGLPETFKNAKDSFMKYTEFAKDRNWRIMPGLSDSGVRETLNIYKNGEIVNRVQETMDKVGNISEGTANLAATAGETLAEEGGKKIVEEAGKELAGELVGKVAAGVGSAKGVAKAGKGMKGIMEGDINYRNISDTVHGTIQAAKVPLMASGPVGWAVVGVSTVWDILDG